MKKTYAIFIMGVSGSGKTTVGKLLAEKMQIPFFDGDDYHPETNRRKMASGRPLNDDDRRGWLETLNKLAREQLHSASCVIACSALKISYRDLLQKDIAAHTKFVFLKGSYEQVMARMLARDAHFMPASLLTSQFDTLEYPTEALVADIAKEPEQIVSEIMETLTHKTEFGLIGLGVMGKSLCRNLAGHGFRISMYNRHVPGKEEHVASGFKSGFPELEDALPFDKLKAFVNSLQVPRKIMLMVPAGKPTDHILEELLPLLSENDVIIDGGNSHYTDTGRRGELLSRHGISFVGCGVSGGEEGALNGPSLMPGGEKAAYRIVRPFLEAIAAKDGNGQPCCTYIGPEGSGHFVKMVHNGIEYAEMQLLAEVYFSFKHTGKTPDRIAGILESWKTAENSFLLEITADILRTREGDHWLIDRILDQAGNKGTGNWTTIASAQLGIPATMIASSLFARYISAFKADRKAMERVYGQASTPPETDEKTVFEAYRAARLINHYQGFRLIKEASDTFGWDLNLSALARTWTNGCIIRSALMERLPGILKSGDNILLHPEIAPSIKTWRSSLAGFVAACVKSGIPVPVFSEAVNFFHGFSSAHLPASLIQAQRDYFGAHTYRRNDDGGEKIHHTHWKKTKGS
ncbi:NADP-dependent phosphogluconate dehydrogenase [Sinomicrobium kalidii]|uniref:NADP-dependent phosphogluconate dehydrogenase n=1 Tax=Sinomicrobium kalidii TaxID=2900738 RepID=UPI001E5B0812|nr:NADP-dependent phosphogluconate dehydrogenase [Sinomicrobium kalidii]UGU17891.1 NADP-dependent phosphogluconate dehydrogenase [Sinomicrobium kalidii]